MQRLLERKVSKQSELQVYTNVCSCEDTIRVVCVVFFVLLVQLLYNHRAPHVWKLGRIC